MKRRFFEPWSLVGALIPVVAVVGYFAWLDYKMRQTIGQSLFWR